MAEEKIIIGTTSSTDLAFERTMLSHERTLLAWVRTSISMISFGFTIYKFFGEMNKAEAARQTLLSPRVVGMIMISFGLLALLLAHLQQRTAVKKLKSYYPDVPKTFSSIISLLVLIFGLLLLLGALFRQ